MHIGSGLNTVSSLYSKQKSNYMKTPASGEKTFYAAETPKVYQIFETDFISMFKECIEDLNKLGRFDLSLLWTKSMDAYLDLTGANSKYK